MSFLLNENSLSLEDFINFVESEETLDFSERLINKIILSSELLKIYEKEIKNYLSSPNHKFYDSCDFLSPKEVKSILLSLIYTLANSNSGVRKETIDEICQYINQEILIPTHTLSLKINSQTPYFFIVKNLKNINTIERNIILQSPGYLIGILCIYFPEIELVRKLLTITSVLLNHLNYIDPYNLAYTPLLPFIKLGENVNLLKNYDEDCNSNINSKTFSCLSEVYKSSDELKELLNIQLNSSQFPIIFIPENKTYKINVLLNSQKIYLIKNIEDLTIKIDKTLLSLLYNSNIIDYPMNQIIYKLKNSPLEDPILNLRERIEVYKDALSFFLYIISLSQKDKIKKAKLTKIIERFFKRKKVSSYLEIKKYLSELISFIENEINELF